MAQAKWYALTPMRQQLLIALGIAILIFGYFLGRSLDSMRPVLQPDEQEQNEKNPAR